MTMTNESTGQSLSPGSIRTVAASCANMESRYLVLSQIVMYIPLFHSFPFDLSFFFKAKELRLVNLKSGQFSSANL